jgi:hypothetical protein
VAIQAEIKRIISELAVIIATENIISDDRSVIKKNIAELEERRKTLDVIVGQKIAKTRNCKEDLERFREFTKIQNGIDFVNDRLAVLGKKRFRS